MALRARFKASIRRAGSRSHYSSWRFSSWYWSSFLLERTADFLATAMGTPTPDLANIPAHPAFETFEPLVERLGRRGFPDLRALNRLAEDMESPPMSLFGAAIHFVPPKRQTSALAYEQRALERGEVGSRDGNWHDVF